MKTSDVNHGFSLLVPGLPALCTALLLASPPAVEAAVSYDSDGDGLIEIDNLAQLNTIRWDLNGDGTVDNGTNAVAYTTAFPDAAASMGCALADHDGHSATPDVPVCTGYELNGDLDFDTDGDGDVDAADEYWNRGRGWEPIGSAGTGNEFVATFDGNGHTISHLYIIRSSSRIGLFGVVGNGGRVRNVGVREVAVTGSGRGIIVGGLAGKNAGIITGSYVTGSVTSTGTGSSEVGGLVGRNGGPSDSGSSIVASYATASVTGSASHGRVGGLAGYNYGSIQASYATGSVKGLGNQSYVGGLVGLHNGGSIAVCYATGSVTGKTNVGGLAGQNDTSIWASYATGAVTGDDFVGGLVGYNQSGYIRASYATGWVTSTGSDVGGLVGGDRDGGISNSYWNTTTSGKVSSAGGEGKTTLELQTPTGYTGIYASWNLDLDNADGDRDATTGGDDPWDFETASDYPALRADFDGDGTATWREFGEQRAVATTPPVVTHSSFTLDGGNTQAAGIWSNGETMWVADYFDARLYAYRLSDGSRDNPRDFSLASANDRPFGIWSDGETMWVVDGDDDKIYAYRMSDRSRDSARDFSLASANDRPFGIWSDGETMWVTDISAKLYAYRLSDGSYYLSGRDFNSLQAAGNDWPEAGIWSDGETMWVVDGNDDKIYAYRMSDRSRDSSRDIDIVAGGTNTRQRGIWSDGETIWVADEDTEKVYVYQMPFPDVALSQLAIGPAPIVFRPYVLSYHIGVANEVTQVTVASYPRVNTATIDINGSSVSSGSGHAVSLAEGRNVITITVTAQDGTTTREYTVTADRGSNAPFGWKVTDDFNDLGLDSGVTPRGIWSSGTTMWVACATGNDNIGANLCSYSMSTKMRGIDGFHTLGTWGNNSPRGIVSDGTTMYVADVRDAKIYAYKMSSYARDSSKEIDLLTAAGNTVPTGITIYIGGIYVADSSDDKIYAYQRHTKQRLTHFDYNTLVVAGNNFPAGIWTDGNTMWVADLGDPPKLYAYTGWSRNASKDFNTLKAAGNTSPRGIWSDGETMWVADSGKNRIFSYNMPSRADATLSGLTVIPDHIMSFSRDVTAYHLGVTNDVTQVWVMPTVNQPGAIIDLDGSSIASGAAHSISLSEGRNDVTLTVTADDGRTTRVYTVTVGRSVSTEYGWNAVEDFNTLNAAENDYPTSLWSDGTTIWVSDLADEKLYAYNRSTRVRDPGKDFDTLGPVGNTSPRGMWSDGKTMWIADPGDERIYAYNIATKSHDRSKDFNTLGAAGNQYPTGLWSDGATLWVVDSQDDKIYAYNLATKVRDAAKDFNNLSGVIGQLAGIWSDGTTMWVVEDRGVNQVGDDKVYAYDMATKARDETKDFDGLTAAGNEEPSGVWSDGTTMWVANYERRTSNNAGDRIRHYSSKIYAYNMPSSGGTTGAATDFNGDGRTDFVDFFLFADAYGGTDARFDLDGNGTVDFADFFKFVDAFGT